MREKLEKAIENSDAHVLKGALDDFVLHNVPDRGEMKKAKDKLKFFEDQKGTVTDSIDNKITSLILFTNLSVLNEKSKHTDIFIPVELFSL